RARILEKIPESEFSEHVKALNLPYQQIFFVPKEALPIINSKHQEFMTQLQQKTKKYETMIDLTKNSSHIALFGAYTVE
ncbi:MAG: hypothetical protein ACW98A_15005, partial [Candidatus Hodarchaeales archaeon]